MKSRKIISSNTKNPSKKPKPILKWQTGKYDRYADFKFILPYQFLLLCKLMDITPERLVADFMDNLSCSSWKREGRDHAKEKLIDYFVEHGYGQHHYATEEIRKIFIEMDAVGILFPKDGDDKIIDIYSEWRDKHYSYWFNKWFIKPQIRF